MKKDKKIVPSKWQPLVMYLWTALAVGGMATGKTLLGGIGNIAWLTVALILAIVVFNWHEIEEETYNRGFKDGLYEKYKNGNTKKKTKM